MTKARQELGKWGEDLALDYLIKKGYVLIERNFSNKYGEIDLIMKDHETIVFVEVRVRSSNYSGTPIESINYKKQKKLLAMGRVYLLKRFKTENIDCRFDALGISLETSQKPIIEHLENAFGL